MLIKKGDYSKIKDMPKGKGNLAPSNPGSDKGTSTYREPDQEEAEKIKAKADAAAIINASQTELKKAELDAKVRIAEMNNNRIIQQKELDAKEFLHAPSL